MVKFYYYDLKVYDIHHNLRTIKVPAYKNQIGKGASSNVYEFRILDHRNEIRNTAFKIDHRDWSREEIEILRRVSHPNIIKMMYTFTMDYSDSEHIIMELCEVDLAIKAKEMHTESRNQEMRDKNKVMIHCWIFQLFRALAYLYRYKIIHRDIKPNNLFVKNDGTLKLGDFNCATYWDCKINDHYIGTRYYRAPELLFEAKEYGCEIDWWSSSCVLAELFLNHVLFKGRRKEYQIYEVIKILGYPTDDDLKAMKVRNISQSSSQDLEFTNLKQIFKDFSDDDDFMNLINSSLIYNPKKRLHPWKICSHPYFWSTFFRKQSDIPFKSMFNFRNSEVESMDKKSRTVLLEFRRIYKTT